ncbi:hypothetical protein E1285_43205 [Actinomadura sp. 7K507]|nr:hypothetical protein E1285_43205 [Actinomadura sp. 7K507]
MALLAGIPWDLLAAAYMHGGWDADESHRHRLKTEGARPHWGRFTDIDGRRFTCFVTETRHGQLADLELRHRCRARCEDCIRCAKDTGLGNLPLHGAAANRIWLENVALASELTAWTQMLALTGHPARTWEPKRPAAAGLLRCRTPGPRRMTAQTPVEQPLALGRPHHHRDHPAEAAPRP